MSRSFKRNPVVKDRNPGMKGKFNHRIRQKMKTEDIANGNSYRKFCCSYDICDWRFSETYGEYLKRMRDYRVQYVQGITLRDYASRMSYYDWYKMYKRK